MSDVAQGTSTTGPLLHSLARVSPMTQLSLSIAAFSAVGVTDAQTDCER